MPAAVAIWVASFLAVPTAVLVNQAVSSDVTTVQNAADEHTDGTHQDAPAAAVVGTGDGTSVDPAADAASVVDVPDQGASVVVDDEAGAGRDGSPASAPAGQDPAVPSGTATLPAPAAAAVSAVPTPSPVVAAGARTSTPATATSAPATPEPSSQPSTTDPELGAALAPTTGP